MSGADGILITGGYGEVGRRLAARLAPEYAGGVVVAGRDGDKGAALARSLGHGARSVAVDVDDPVAVESALNGIALVVEGRGSSAGVQLSLVGRNQAEATALGTALIVRALYDGKVSQPGVWYPEQVIAPAPFFDALAAHGLKVTATEVMPALRGASNQVGENGGPR